MPTKDNFLFGHQTLQNDEAQLESPAGPSA